MVCLLHRFTDTGLLGWFSVNPSCVNLLIHFHEYQCDLESIGVQWWS